MSTVQSPELPLSPPQIPGGDERTPAAPKPEASARSGFAPAPTYEGLRVYQLSVDQYQRMAECEIIGSADRIFLIDGILVRKMSKNPPHIIATDNLMPILVRAIPDGWYLSNQNPIETAPDSAPEPDFRVTRGKPADYRRRLVTGADTAIVIEVSDTSLAFDQKVMKARYAAALIPQYWIVNLVAMRIEVYTDPTGPDPFPTYRHREDYGPDASVPFRLEGREIARILVSDILPPD